MSKTWSFEAAEVAEFLQHTPQFFEEYADLIAEIFVPHPHNGQAIPLAKRQMLNLREKNQQLAKTLHRLIDYGKENDALSNKLHDFTLTLMGARNRQAVFNTIQYQLPAIFTISHLALRFWWPQPLSPQTAQATQLSQAYFIGLQKAQCQTEIPIDIRRWFNDQANLLQSFALIPLGKEQIFGGLVLASVDSQRFSAEQETFYLQRLRTLLTEAFLAKSN